MIKRNLTDYNFPDDLKGMSVDEMELLSFEIRNFLIENISKTGGHLASNLGAVELSLALHKFFDSPEDKIIWDVGHQTYVHKILTGRAQYFHTLRQMDGLSGFPKQKESQHDIFDTGHSSASLSFAAGLAASRDLDEKKYDVVAVIGDGALTGGLAYEALNNIGDSKTRMTVILNDNGMSISPNTGSVSKHLGKLRGSQQYLNFKKNVKKTVTGIPSIGNTIYSGMRHLRDSIKYTMIDGGVLFEELGFKYYGPIDGHNIEEILYTLQTAKEINGPVLIHAITKKGKGYKNAEEHPNKFHGIGPFDSETGAPLTSPKALTYSEVFGKKLKELAKDDKRIVAVSAAMLEGTGLDEFQKSFPKRTFDVGIAEEHAVTFSAGLAKNHYRPFVSIYSTFLQRAYDEILEDVCLQNLPVIFTIDRSGIVGADGETHHGIFDLSYLNHMPNMTVMAPMDGEELAAMMEHAIKLTGPCAIRYPRGEAYPLNDKETFCGDLEKSRVFCEGKDVEIWAVGNMVHTGLSVCQQLRKQGVDAGLVNARWIKPLDMESLTASARRTKKIVTLEDNVLTGGFGQAVITALTEKGIHIPVKTFGWPDKFIEHGSCEQLMKKFALDAESLTERISDFVERKA